MYDITPRTISKRRTFANLRRATLNTFELRSRNMSMPTNPTDSLNTILIWAKTRR